ncbi:MAG: transposase [Lewinella sp.]
MPYDSQIPVVCLDETTKQLIDDAQEPYVDAKGVIYQDYEYVRKGVRTIYMITEPLGNRREVKVRGSGSGRDYAEVLAYIAEEMYADKSKIHLVEDNLKAHNLKFLYEIYEPARALAIAEKFIIVRTPKHGSWLNIAECEIGVLRSQALKGRIGDAAILKNQAEAWAKNRNEAQLGVDWQFTVEDARVKLKRLYPTIMT